MQSSALHPNSHRFSSNRPSSVSYAGSYSPKSSSSSAYSTGGNNGKARVYLFTSLLVILGLYFLYSFVNANESTGNKSPSDYSNGDNLQINRRANDWNVGSERDIPEKLRWKGGKKTVLVTGGAGFIGSHTTEALVERGDDVVIVDEMNDYYDITIKEDNIKHLIEHYGFDENGSEQEKETETEKENGKGAVTFHQLDICDRDGMKKLFEEEKRRGREITHVCHLAARAGVRYSIENPDAYIHSNLQGTLVLLDLARDFEVRNFVYASSSSVYGENTKVPFSEEDRVDNPVSPYAATKRSMELLCSTYNLLYKIPMAGLRFFTVYGPRGRPDMAPFKFIKNIYEGKEILKYGDGTTSRDYTFIKDIVSGILASIDRPFAKMQVFNLGNSRTVNLNEFIDTIERVLEKKANIKPLPLQPGDVPRTFADLSKSRALLDYDPQVTIEEGLRSMAEWYIAKYGSKRKE